MIHYITRQRKNPINSKSFYYAEIAPVTPLNIEDICANLTEVCTITRHDVKSVLSALQSEIVKACQNGQSVRLGDLGSFRPTIVGTGMTKPEEVNRSMISRVRCRFTPGSLIKKRLSKNNSEVKFGSFHIVPPVTGGGGGL